MSWRKLKKEEMQESFRRTVTGDHRDRFTANCTTV
jgi:hypothetical protein